MLAAGHHSPSMRVTGRSRPSSGHSRLAWIVPYAVVAINGFSGLSKHVHDDRPRWDQRFADQLDGAVVLVGMTYNEPSGKRVEQFFGTVIATHETEGVTLLLEGTRSGETFRLPPDLRAFFPAKPGSYRLRATGEIVVDPDFTTTWERNAPQN